MITQMPSWYSRLIAGQKFTNEIEIYPLFVVAFYALNIIDANVDAALQFNVDENISFKPSLYTNDVTLKANVGLTLIIYNFRTKQRYLSLK
jgi:hypothetical protein